MDPYGEKFREYAANGNYEAVDELIQNRLIDINSANEVNGWTALHWAAHRNRKQIVNLLLNFGADKKKVNFKGETPADVCKHKELRILLGDSTNETDQDLPITPNYLRYPPLTESGIKHNFNNSANHNNEELVLKVRIANCGDPDFIEIELPKTELTFSQLVKICCEELNTTPNQISKIRKLPNTILRKDKDVQRLTDYQEIELVLSTPSTSNTGIMLTNPISSSVNGNGYESIYLRKNQTILY